LFCTGFAALIEGLQHRPCDAADLRAQGDRACDVEPAANAAGGDYIMARLASEYDAGCGGHTPIPELQSQLFGAAFRAQRLDADPRRTACAAHVDGAHADLTQPMGCAR